MKTINKVPFQPVFVEFVPDELEDGKVYISEEYGCAIHKCLCGCGNKTIMNLSVKPHWTLVKEKDETVSFIGSIGNFQFPCKSHYVMTKNIANFL